jgi:hypothetical protein
MRNSYSILVPKFNLLGDLGVDERALKWASEMWCGSVKWINLSQDRVQWRGIVTTVWVP